MSATTLTAPLPAGSPLAALHDAAGHVRHCWERLALMPRDEIADDPAALRRYADALWQVQSAEEDYLRLREQLLGG